MSLHYQVKKAYQDELLQTAAKGDDGAADDLSRWCLRLRKGRHGDCHDRSNDNPRDSMHGGPPLPGYARYQ